MLNPLALYRYDPWKVLRTYEPITVNQAVDATKFQGKEPVREGLVPQPYDSGESHTDQGISRQGNRRVRALLVEMAWTWLRFQPGSMLTQWFNQRTQGTGPNRRARRIAIVAVARRLAIALWRYLKDGVIPEGAQLKLV